MATEYPFEINGVDFRRMVERDSYQTGLIPVYTDTITTMDGVDHDELIRWRGKVSVKINPQTAEDAAAFCAELMKPHVTLLYHCQQRNASVYAKMRMDALSSIHLSRCRHLGKKWVEPETFTFTEK